MAEKRPYVCRECGYRHPQWLGRCPNCGSWGTLLEEEGVSSKAPSRAIATSEILRPEDEEGERRIRTGMEEFNRALGGGIVEGSVVLLGGAPGMGKSTLLLQVLDQLASQGVDVLYCSTEESLPQVRSKLRLSLIHI